VEISDKNGETLLSDFSVIFSQKQQIGQVLFQNLQGYASLWTTLKALLAKINLGRTAVASPVAPCTPQVIFLLSASILVLRSPTKSVLHLISYLQ